VSGNSLRQTVHTHRASVYQAAKLVAALLRVVRVTAGLTESNGSLPPGLWLTSPVGWLLSTEISSRTIRSVIEYGLPLPFYVQTDSIGVDSEGIDISHITIQKAFHRNLARPAAESRCNGLYVLLLFSFCVSRFSTDFRQIFRVGTTVAVVDQCKISFFRFLKDVAMTLTTNICWFYLQNWYSWRQWLVAQLGGLNLGFILHIVLFCIGLL